MVFEGGTFLTIIALGNNFAENVRKFPGKSGQNVDRNFEEFLVTNSEEFLVIHSREFLETRSKNFS